MPETKIKYPKDFKLSIQEYCLKTINNKINDITSAIQTSREGMLNETKSSAGDKHETSRAMMQIDIEQFQVQLQKVRETEIEINSISTGISNINCNKGSLVTTNLGVFYLGSAIGKISVDDIDLFAISLQSPLGLQFLHKKKGDEFKFLDKTYKIIQID